MKKYNSEFKSMIVELYKTGRAVSEIYILIDKNLTPNMDERMLLKMKKANLAEPIPIGIQKEATIDRKGNLKSHRAYWGDRRL